MKRQRVQRRMGIFDGLLAVALLSVSVCAQAQLTPMQRATLEIQRQQWDRIRGNTLADLESARAAGAERSSAFSDRLRWESEQTRRELEQERAKRDPASPTARLGSDNLFLREQQARKEEQDRRLALVNLAQQIRAAQEALRAMVQSGELWRFGSAGPLRARALDHALLVQRYAAGEGWLGVAELDPAPGDNAIRGPVEARLGRYDPRQELSDFGVWAGLAYWDTSEYLAAVGAADGLDPAGLRSTAVDVLQTCVRVHRSAECHRVLAEILRLRGDVIPSGIDKSRLATELADRSGLRSHASLDKAGAGGFESHWQALRNRFPADEAAWQAADAARRQAAAEAAARARAARTESFLARARHLRSRVPFDDTKRRQLETMVVLAAADRAADDDARASLLRWIHEDRGTNLPEGDPAKHYPTLSDETILLRVRTAARRGDWVTQSVRADFEAQLRATLEDDIVREMYQWSRTRPVAAAPLPAAPVAPANPAQAAYWKGSASWEKRDFKSALPDLQEAVRLEPDNVAYLQRLASAYQQSGEAALALPLLEKGLSLKPDDPTLHLGLAEALAAAGRHDEALKSADRAVALRPGSGYFRDQRDALVRRSQGSTPAAAAASARPAPAPLAAQDRARLVADALELARRRAAAAGGTFDPTAPLPAPHASAIAALVWEGLKPSEQWLAERSANAPEGREKAALARLQELRAARVCSAEQPSGCRALMVWAQKTFTPPELGKRRAEEVLALLLCHEERRAGECRRAAWAFERRAGQPAEDLAQAMALGYHAQACATELDRPLPAGSRSTCHLAADCVGGQRCGPPDRVLASSLYRVACSLGDAEACSRGPALLATGDPGAMPAPGGAR